MRKKAINIGSGPGKQKSNEAIDWVNLDNNPEYQPDCLRNILQGIPFNDNSFDVAVCSHFLEHFNSDDLVFVMNEIHRVLKPQGELHVLSPYYKFWGAYQDPHHKIFFTEHAFEPWWFPNQSNFSMGIRGFFHPIVLEVAEEMEIRSVMRKIPAEQLKSYVEQVGEREEGVEGCRQPDWLEKLRGTKYYRK
jgi:SAM-dependent methyltransferase